MTIDLHTLFSAGLGVAFSILGWFARELWQAVQQLRADLSALQVLIGTDYVRYDRLRDAMQPIMDALSDIRDQLGHKVDK